MNPKSALWIFIGWCCGWPLIWLITIPLFIGLDRKGHLNRWLDRMKRKDRRSEEDEE